MRPRSSVAVFGALLLVACRNAPAVHDDSPSSRSGELEAALALAGPNRDEIERALARFDGDEEPERRAALEFLIANMPGQGFIDYALVDDRGREVPFDALAYASLAEAQAALRALEAEHGPLDFAKKTLVEDLRTLRAEDLVRTVQQAFETWRSRPWARGLSFETFCETLLPYRGSNEPFEDWRGLLAERVEAALADLPESAPAGEAAARAASLAARLVGFSDLYYLHPTDQSCAQMLAARRGRCEDITNMTTYAMRLAGVASAADYTPWWGHRDNNHAWPVVLDAEGRGHAADGARAAKVYRKTFARQRDSLVSRLGPGEQAPPWLDRAHYVDVTDQYMPTSDVALALDDARGQRFAYLCVFNGGEWRPIQWSPVTAGSVRFERMGRNLVYLPALWIEGAVVPAAAPLFLATDGSVTVLRADATRARPAELLSSDAARIEHDADGRPRARFVAGKTYELSVWRDGWSSLGTRTAAEPAQPLRWEDLPSGALFWLRPDGSRGLERVFRIEDGLQVWM